MYNHFLCCCYFGIPNFPSQTIKKRKTNSIIVTKKVYSHCSFLYSHIQVLKYRKGIFLFSIRLEGVSNTYGILANLLPCCLLVICTIGHFTTTSVVIVVLSRESKFRNMLRIKTFFFCYFIVAVSSSLSSVGCYS